MNALSQQTERIIYALGNAQVRTYPFPHFLAERVFPSGFYRKLMDSLPADDKYTSGEYKNRRFAAPDIPELEDFQSRRFIQSMVRIFKPWARQRYPDSQPRVFTDLRLVRDSEGYCIGPHTDAEWKIISLLFYLPKDGSHEDCGTSIYVPNELEWQCPGGPHYKFDPFTRVATMPYRPNSCFGFWKTTNSFHGVEPVPVQFDRDVLLWNLYDLDLYEKLHGKAS